MKLTGKYYKSSNFWLAEVPFIQLMDQGKTKKEVLTMLKLGVEELVGVEGFTCETNDLGEGEFTLSSNNVKLMAAFILRRLREAQGLTIREAATLMNMKSHTEYARHESGKVAMTLETFNRYVEKIANRDFLIRIA